MVNPIEIEGFRTILVDDGFSSLESISFRAIPKKKEYDLLQQIPHKGFYTLDVHVDDLSFKIQQEIRLANLTIKDVESGAYPIARFQNAFTEQLSEQDYLRYLQLLLAEHSSAPDVLDYFEYLHDTDVQSESLGWYCLLSTQNPNLVQIPSITALWKGVYNLLNGNCKLALKYFDDEKESNVLHGCYQICWMLEGISGNEGYWKTPYQNKNCGILGTIHRVLTTLSEWYKPAPSGSNRSRGTVRIEDLGLSVRSYNCLKRAGIRTTDDLTAKSLQDLMRVRNLGRKSREEVIRKLKEAGFSIKNEA